MQLMTLARWLAHKAVKSEWRAQGRKVQYIHPGEITKETNLYLALHKARLMREAWEHPISVRYRQQDRMRLARRAVIAEIRENGRRVSSIAPDELHKLIGKYLEDHPEKGVFLRDCGCRF
jgi:NAD(P)-dependent dehydrogenase (short-subunit alcohol dehydrogenase family)